MGFTHPQASESLILDMSPFAVQSLSRAVEVVPCISWDDFRNRLRNEHSEEIIGNSPLYRGHADPRWKLASPWERRLEQLSAYTHQRSRRKASNLLANVLRDFKDLAIGLPGVRARELVSEDDWWTLGRHYGLATPLLDWTKSPYVAAFFAFTGFVERVSPGATTTGVIDAKRVLGMERGTSVAIWSLMISRTSEIDATPEHLEIVKTRTDIGHRQRAQRGVFTRLTHDSYFCLEDYLEFLGLSDIPLRLYLIPAWEAARAITELRMMNITFATLFPDLDGAALQANFELVIHALAALSKLKSDLWTARDPLST